MLAETCSWTLIETGNWGTRSPTFFYRFNGPGDLYCRGCAHNILWVCRTKTGVRCLDCGQTIDVEIQSFIHQDQQEIAARPRVETKPRLNRRHLGLLVLRSFVTLSCLE